MNLEIIYKKGEKRKMGFFDKLFGNYKRKDSQYEIGDTNATYNPRIIK